MKLRSMGHSPCAWATCRSPQLGRESCLKTDSFCSDRVDEFYILRVQEISSIAGKTGAIFKRQAGRTIKRIADQGMADGCQMDSDLMRSTRMKPYLKGCGACAACDHFCR